MINLLGYQKSNKNFDDYGDLKSPTLSLKRDHLQLVPI